MSWWIPRAAGQRPKVQVGVMNFGKRTPEDESSRVVRRALERGLDFFDVANAYNDGESEKILGRALGKERDKVTIATKVGFGKVDGKPEGLARPRILAACDASLARLGTDRIDLYYLHVPDYKTPIEESLDALHELLDEKKILRRLVLTENEVGAKLAACSTMSCVDGLVTEGMEVDFDAGPRLNYWIAIGGQKVQYSGTADPAVFTAEENGARRLAGKIAIDDSRAGGPKIDATFDAPLALDLDR